MSPEFLAEELKLVANAPNGFEDPFITYTLKLLSESLDMNINCSGVAEVIKAPYLVKKLISCKHAIVIRCKEVKQLELLRRNINSLTLELKLILLL